MGTIVSFSGALPVLAWEGVAKFWITLYKHIPLENEFGVGTRIWERMTTVEIFR